MEEILHHLLHEVVTYSAMGFEWIGVLIVAISGVRGVIELFKRIRYRLASESGHGSGFAVYALRRNCQADYDW